MVVRKLIAVAVVFAFCFVSASLFAAEQNTARTLQGQVVSSRNDSPLPDSVVYLKNTKTLAVRTFIADKSGNYRFSDLSPNIDYEVHAELKGAKSDTKTLSSFDSRKNATINLRIDTQ